MDLKHVCLCFNRLMDEISSFFGVYSFHLICRAASGLSSDEPVGESFQKECVRILLGGFEHLNLEWVQHSYHMHQLIQRKGLSGIPER